MKKILFLACFAALGFASQAQTAANAANTTTAKPAEVLQLK